MLKKIQSSGDQVKQKMRGLRPQPDFDDCEISFFQATAR